MPSPIDDDTLQRFHDGDLSPAEARGLSQQLARDPAAQQRLRALEELSALVRDASAEIGAELDSDALFRAIEARLPQRAAPSLPPPRPANVRPITRRRSVWVPALAATAVAAATMLVVLRSGEHDGGGGEAIPQVAMTEPSEPEIAEKTQALVRSGDGQAQVGGAEGDGDGDIQHARVSHVDADTALVSTAQGSRLERVDFGRNSGTAFQIEGEAVGVTVVWLDDQDAP